ncbi:MAG: hypothetical protein ABH956_02910 [Candidatus Nealsonbacteria bacterium]
MEKEIQIITEYVKDKLSKTCKKNFLEFYEIILIPKIPFYIIARLNAFNIDLSDNRLDKIEEELLRFQKYGIRCIVRPRNFIITDKVLNKKILEKSYVLKKYRIPRLKSYPIFRKEIQSLSKEIKNYLKIKDDIFFWEIEINPNKIFPFTALFLTDEKLIFSKKQNLMKIEILPFSNLKIMRSLLDLTYVVAIKKKSLLRYLLIDKEN